MGIRKHKEVIGLEFRKCGVGFFFFSVTMLAVNNSNHLFLSFLIYKTGIVISVSLPF